MWVCVSSSVAGLLHGWLTVPDLCRLLWTHWPLHALHWAPHYRSHHLSYWVVTVWLSWDQCWLPLGSGHHVSDAYKCYLNRNKIAKSRLFVVTVALSPSVISIFTFLLDTVLLTLSFFFTSRTTALITLFSQYLRHIPVPFPVFTKEKKLHFTRVYVFQILPVCISQIWVI